MNTYVVPVETIYEEWFSVGQFGIEVALAGAEHLFLFKGNEISIQLPNIPIDENCDELSGVAVVHARQPSTNEPISLAIFAVRFRTRDQYFKLPYTATLAHGMRKRAQNLGYRTTIGDSSPGNDLLDCGVHSRCGPHTCAVTYVTATQRLQTFRHLHACSGCFRLERSPASAPSRPSA